MTFRYLLLSCLVVVLGHAATPSPSPEQRAEDREHHRRGQPRVILYEHPDFRGGAIVLYPGDQIDNLEYERFDDGRRANDRISSIQVDGDAEVTVFEDARFRGEGLRLDRSVAFLGDIPRESGRGSWDDLISSIRVEYRRDSGRDWRGEPRIDPDRLVRRAYLDILQREPDASGMRTFRTRIIEQGWTEVMVRESLRRSEEYRGPVVNRMIERAYRDLLGRAPDANGLDHYRNQIIDKGMTEEDMRNDLRRSAEYRNRGKAPSPPPANPSRRPHPAGDDRTTDAR